jgi:hypothetical protein
MAQQGAKAKYQSHVHGCHRSLSWKEDQHTGQLYGQETFQRVDKQHGHPGFYSKHAHGIGGPGIFAAMLADIYTMKFLGHYHGRGKGAEQVCGYEQQDKQEGLGHWDSFLSIHVLTGSKNLQGPGFFEVLPIRKSQGGAK